MSEVRMVVREASFSWSGTVHGSVADRAIAALAADLVTLKELDAACGRYYVREVLQTSDESVAEALIQPVLSRFTDTLAAVAAARVELAPKCESLTSSLARFLEPEPEELDGSDSPYEFGDDDLPF